MTKTITRSLFAATLLAAIACDASNVEDEAFRVGLVAQSDDAEVTALSCEEDGELRIVSTQPEQTSMALVTDASGLPLVVGTPQGDRMDWQSPTSVDAPSLDDCTVDVMDVVGVDGVDLSRVSPIEQELTFRQANNSDYPSPLSTCWDGCQEIYEDCQAEYGMNSDYCYDGWGLCRNACLVGAKIIDIFK